jgi:hypothetical protein
MGDVGVPNRLPVIIRNAKNGDVIVLSYAAVFIEEQV